MSSMTGAAIRHNWTLKEIQALFELPFNDLLFQAQSIHRQYHDPNAVQISTLLSIKTGACPEDCKYCSQSGHYNTGLEKEKLLEIERVVQEAQAAKEKGASRFCMGAAWRSPKDRDMEQLEAMIHGVKELGMETCMTLGMLDDNQVFRLRDAGLDYYNHNIDTSERYYSEIITTRTFADRIDTLNRVREAGMKVCAGGIVGMGEQQMDRIDMMLALATLEQHPDSVPVNMLIPIENTPLADVEKLDPIEFVRTVALARILMPKSHVRLSAGRTEMTDEMQAMCIFAGANSIFVGDTLLTADNPEEDSDQALFDRLGVTAMNAGCDGSR